MKRISTLIVILAISVSSLMAQNLEIKGSVYDFDSAEPLYPAAVQVFSIAGTDTVYVNGVSTEEDGTFSLGGLKAGNYMARTTFLGYNENDKNFTLRSGTQTTDLGRISLRSDGITLQTVAISAVAAKVQIDNDTVMFNSAAFKLPEGSSVEDLIRKSSRGYPIDLPVHRPYCMWHGHCSVRCMRTDSLPEDMYLLR
jgi:hypothetical protein